MDVVIVGLILVAMLIIGIIVMRKMRRIRILIKAREKEKVKQEILKSKSGNIEVIFGGQKYVRRPGSNCVRVYDLINNLQRQFDLTTRDVACMKKVDGNVTMETFGYIEVYDLQGNFKYEYKTNLQEDIVKRYKKGIVILGVRRSKGERFYISDIVRTNEGNVYILYNLDKKQIKTIRRSSLSDYKIAG